MSPVLELRGVGKAFGGLTVADRIDLAFKAGELHALIGPNGAGKSSLIAQIAGEIRPDRGRILYQGRDIVRLPVHARAQAGIARSFQTSELIGGFSVRDNVALALGAAAGRGSRFWDDPRRDRDRVAGADAHLRAVGLDAFAERPAATLGHGERRLLELAVALAPSPRVLLLDEPLAGLAAAEAEAITRRLAALKGRHTILLVEHDVNAVFRLADRVSVLVAGRLVVTGAAEAVRAHPEVRSAYLGTET